MELSDLKIFHAVVKTGGISHAARLLNRVPSNITARIQKLESELDKQLFIREKNRLRISPAGERLLNYAHKIIILADEALEQLNDNHPTGKLRLGSMEAVAASRLSDTLMNYHQAFPDIELEVSTNPTGRLIEQVLAGDLDLALVADPPRYAKLCITPIFSEKLVLVSGLQQIEIKHPKDLGSNPTLLGFSPACAYRTRLADWVKESDIIAKVIEINSYHALLNCVTAGMGVGLIPEILLDFYPFKAGLKVHALPKHLETTTTSLIWRVDSLKPSMSAFNDLLLKASNIKS